MKNSRDSPKDLLRDVGALQHERAPRPLPLFLELLRKVAERDPETAHDALRGLSAYAAAERPHLREPRPQADRIGGAVLRDYGGSGPPLVLVPSLINPPKVLDLDAESSLTDALARTGRRVLLLDWGPAGERTDLGIGAHVEEILAPMIVRLDRPPAILGYCLGGTMALAAANIVPVERIATIAAPWRFAAYPQDARAALATIWRQAKDAAHQFGALPMEVLQAAFWSLDPERTVRKFASFAALDPDSPAARRFVALEDWANEGEPLPYPAARELIEDLFGADLAGGGRWDLTGRTLTDDLSLPRLHLVSDRDRIAPAATAPEGDKVAIAAGHVGMVIGSSRGQLHAELARFLNPDLAARPRQG